MDLAKIERLLEIVAQSGMAEVTVEEGEFRLVVRAASAAPPPAPAYAPPPPAVAAPMAAAPAPAAAAPSAPAAPAMPDGVVVQAPIVGTFYEAPSPDADPFVVVGKAVREGDVLCIIEAMKLMNEIKAEVSGTVREVLVKNATPVEYDQPLFVIEPA